MNKSKKLIALFTLVLIIVISAFGINSAKYNYPEKDELNKRINYLEKFVNTPVNESIELKYLSMENYEFKLFAYSFTSFAMVNIALKDTSYTKRANNIIRNSVKAVLKPEISVDYGIENIYNINSEFNNYSIIYLGHLNLMLSSYRLISDDTTYNRLNDKISEVIAKRYMNKEFMLLESYASLIWIPDNTVALASLNIHSKVSGSDYNIICEKWVDYAKNNLIHTETGTLYTTVNSETGEPEELPRGGMLGYSIMFIYQFDKDFAGVLYDNYLEHFSNNFVVFRLFKEWYKDKSTHEGDIDSGPVFLGYSIPANEFALASAVLSGDFKTAKKMERLVSFGTKEIKKNNELKYKVRFTKMNISPMAEAIVLYSLTANVWI